jgi:hypothetical protein
MKITELAEERGIPFKEGGQHHHVQFGYVGFDCPTCSPDWQAFRLGYNLEKQFLSCWVCGFRPLISTLAEVFRTTTHEIKQLLNLVEKEYKKVNVYAGKLVLPKNLVPLMNQHKRYLRQRGFDLNELESIWRINQGIGISSYLCWRVFIPIYHKGKVVSWTTRSISDEVDKRYINASPSEEAMKIKSILYGEEFCNHSVIVCEGPTDAWNVGCGAVCTFGLGITRSQLNKISKYPKRIICLDSSKEAQAKAMEICDSLKVLGGETINVIIDAKDPGSASKKEIKLLRGLL